MWPPLTAALAEVSMAARRKSLSSLIGREEQPGWLNHEIDFLFSDKHAISQANNPLYSDRYIDKDPM